jgi:hypothetical protein
MYAVKSHGTESGIKPIPLPTRTANYIRLQLTLIISTAQRTGPALARHVRSDDRMSIQAVATFQRNRPHRPVAPSAQREASPSCPRSDEDFALTCRRYRDLTQAAHLPQQREHVRRGVAALDLFQLLDAERRSKLARALAARMGMQSHTWTYCTRTPPIVSFS